MRREEWTQLYRKTETAAPRLLLSVSLRLNNGWNDVMCLLCVPVSYCLLDIYINQLQAKHFQNIASDNVLNHIKALWHL